MIRTSVLAVVLASVLTVLIVAATAGSAPPVQQNHFAFVDVNVVPMDADRVLTRQTVIVREGRIVRIGGVGTTRPPREATIIDGRGRFLMPGLSEMHAHIPPAQAGDTTIERTLFLYLANGITTVRGMLGQQAHLRWRDRANRGEILSPRIHTSGPSVNGNSVQTPDSARRTAIHQRNAGYDFIKIHPGLRRDVYDALARAADSVGIPFAGHVPLDVGLVRALQVRQRTIDHLDGFIEALLPADAPVTAEQSQFFGINLAQHADEARIPQLVRATRESGVWIVPTYSLFMDFLSAEEPASMAQRPELRYMPQQTVQQWQTALQNFRGSPNYSADAGRRFLELHRRILREMHQAGVPLLLGSDAPQIFNVPGFAMHQEMRGLSEAGIPNFAILQSGTVNVARFFGEQNVAGTVAAGRRADLVLLEGNPLADLANVRRVQGVMIGGRWLPRAELDRRLGEIERAYQR